MNINRLFFIVLFMITASAFFGPYKIIKASCTQKYCQKKTTPRCCKSCSHTFFRARPISQDIVLESALHSSHAKNVLYDDLKGEQSWLFLQGNFFYYHSTNEGDLAKFFLPKNKRCIRIAEDNESDVSSPWLSLISEIGTSFSSNVRLCPKRKVFGGLIQLHADLSFLSQCPLWLKISAPIVHVRHNIRFSERLTGEPAGDGVLPNGIVPRISNARDAFNNPRWHFGKIVCEDQTKTGFDDFAIKVGWNFVEDECGLGSLYGIVFVPISDNESKGEFLFEPTIGNGGHVGLGFGLNGWSNVWARNEHQITLMADFRYVYFLKSNEIRSFDLCNSQWSRYLIVAPARDVLQHLPGINLFTQCFEITPRSSIELWFAGSYRYKKVNIELGYDFWWRAQEKSFLSPSNNRLNHVVFDIARIANGGGELTSASQAMICQAVGNLPGSPESDDVITPIEERDYNLSSAAHPRAYSSKIYTSISYDGFSTEYPTMTGLGVSYEFGHSRSALSQFGIWWKLGVVF